MILLAGHALHETIDRRPNDKGVGTLRQCMSGHFEGFDAVGDQLIQRQVQLDDGDIMTPEGAPVDGADGVRFLPLHSVVEEIEGHRAGRWLVHDELVGESWVSAMSGSQDVCRT
ncbi:hypothetical protein D3C75_963780 [compost metagenome]